MSNIGQRADSRNALPRLPLFDYADTQAFNRRPLNPVARALKRRHGLRDAIATVYAELIAGGKQ